jgi:beta-lactam-binding protein with PASTA domain
MLVVSLTFLNAAGASAQRDTSRRAVALRTVARTWNFETGDLRGWTVSGQAFDHQPTFQDNPTARGRGQPAGQQGQFWIGTYELYQRDDPNLRPGGIQGDGPQGTLTSSEFTVSTDSMSFLVGGGASPQTGVELVLVVNLIDIAEQRVQFASGENGETMRRVSWDLKPYAGQTARIRIIDASSGPWGHVNADDFRFFHAAAAPAPSLIGVPALIGKDVPQASALLDSVGLRLGHVDSVDAAAKPPGLVWNQYPIPNSRVAPGTQVTVYVARPPEPTAVSVPDVVGRSLARADSMISATGLHVGRVDEIITDTAAPGVVQQFPPAESRVSLPGHVDLIIAVTPAPALVRVPTVVGRGVAEASRRIRSAGLVIGSVSGRGAARGDLVVGTQAPPAGDSAPVGSRVDLALTPVAPPMVPVPDLVGLPLSKADSLLAAKGLQLSRVTYAGSSSDSGTVLVQDPAANQSVAVGTGVDLHLAIPLAIPPAWPPDWLRTAAIVLGLVAAAGFVWWRARPPPDPSSPQISQVSARPGAAVRAQEFEATGPTVPDFEVRVRPGMSPGVHADIDQGSVLEERRE